MSHSEGERYATILVADDDRSIRTVLHQAMARLGHQVQVTGNVTTLWNWVEQGAGDLLITDVIFPDGDALDILPRIRKIRPDMPVIVMSARNIYWRLRIPNCVSENTNDPNRPMPRRIRGRYEWLPQNSR